MLIDIKNLEIGFNRKSKFEKAVNNISFSFNKGEILGVVGESGSGKSLTALAILKLLPQTAVVSNGQILYENKKGEKIDLLKLNEKKLRNIRGKEISMIFQEPMTSLNPVMKCGRQVAEEILIHTNTKKKDIKNLVMQSFREVKLSLPERIYNSYPHELSGGQRQRVMIAMAIICNPALLIADEPTTALDVIVQNSILELLKELQRKSGMSIFFISHDLAVISKLADKIIIMNKGSIVESGDAKKILKHPKHPYTQGLLSCRPTLKNNSLRLPVLSDFYGQKEKTNIVAKQKINKNNNEPKVLLKVKNLNKTFVDRTFSISKKKNKQVALKNISFELYKGETLGLVGESGCGKTTLGQIVISLLKSDKGEIEYNGKEISLLRKKERNKYKRKVQIIFQDPNSSLNPKLTVGKIIYEVLKVHNIEKTVNERKRKVFMILNKVKLDNSYYNRYPHELSGGQQQRIGIARALVLNPELIICDESVSALDVSIQAEVLNLLNDLKEEFGFTYIFISHDLSVVKYMSDRVMVMRKGEIVEINKADEIYNSPASEYTKELISAIEEIS